MQLVQRASIRQFIKFSVVGFVSFVIDSTIYLLLSRWAGIFYLYAKVISFCVAATNSYLWNRRWTFRSRTPQRFRQFTQFFIVAGVGVSLNAGIMYLLHGLLHLHDLIALLIATGTVMFWNFFANRSWTFRQTR